MAEIKIRNLSVEFPVYDADRVMKKALFRHTVGGLINRDKGHRNRVVVSALKDITLDIRDGDRLGLIGQNGAGKTTLLHVIAGIYEPYAGTVVTQGRLSPLFNTMLGMDHDDTGRQNIITCGLYLGMSMTEIESKRADIEEFTELEEFLTLPVRTYSSGMAMRLAFGIVTAIEPGILLMDEVIGAGDARFQAKARSRIEKMMQRTQILVLASHSDSTIRDMCNRAALMDSGRLLKVGDVEEVISAYHELNARRNAEEI